jgi:N-acetylglutamate synthase-like GNAT family acetyltransferase
MSDSRPIILKIGGSAITDKTGELAAKTEIINRLAEEIKRAVDTSYVAEIKGKVVGFMISYMTYGNFGADRCAWIAMVGVDPKWLGQGIGKRLAEEIFKVYKEKGVTEVFTSVRWDATDILSFFKTLGFERSNFINLWKKVE